MHHSKNWRARRRAERAESARQRLNAPFKRLEWSSVDYSRGGLDVSGHTYKALEKVSWNNGHVKPSVRWAEVRGDYR